jgi:hypothetical protein
MRIGIGVVILLLLSCGNNLMGKTEAIDNELIIQNPIHISWKGDKKKDIEGFSANVTVYKKNSRESETVAKNNTYRMAIKSEGNSINARIDFDKDDRGAYRSVISNNNEIVIFDTNIEQIQLRHNLKDSFHPDLAAFNFENMISRINLSKIRGEAARLSFDSLEDDAKT